MKKFKINLQLFADDAGSGADNTAGAAGAAGADDANNGADQSTDNKQQPDTKPGAEEKKYTDADVDKLIDKKFAEWQKKKDKEVDEAKKLADMNAQQKAEYERDKLQKELDDYKRKDALAEMSKTARKMLSDEGISISDELLSRLVTTDAAETKSAVDSFTKLFKAAVDDAVKDKARGTTPKNITNNGNAMSEIEQRIAKYETN